MSDEQTGCIDVVMLEIEQTNPLSASSIVQSAPNCDQANGAVTIVPEGGSGNYSYSWGPSATRTDLAAGVYTPTITDQESGCTTTLTITLTNNVANATVTVNPVLELTCAGDANGQVDFSIDYAPGFAQDAQVQIWESTTNGVVVNGNLSAGNYCIVIFDANDCLAGQACFEVVEPLALSVNAIVLDATCEEQGGISLEITGGTAPYIVDWQDLPDTEHSTERSDLAPGNYQLTITDANDCRIVIDDLVVGDDCGPCTDPVVVTINTTDAQCDQANGSAVIELAGNEANYVYQWTGGVSTGPEANNLGAGIYTVTITDISDITCYTELSLTIASIDGPVATILSSTPSGCTTANGSAVLSPSDFIYIWEDTGLPAAERTNLAAGSYNVLVREPGNPCTNVLTVEIVAENELLATTTILSQPTCGNADGAVEIEVNGGSGQYDYSWDGDASRTGLEAGAYHLTVTDELSGCTAVIDFTLLDDVAIANISIAPEWLLNCAGDANGTVSYSLDLSPGFVGTGNVTLYRGTEVVENGSLSAGTYALVVTNDDGCFAGQANFTVLEPEVLTLQAGVQDATCEQLGQIHLTASGGTGELSYAWSGNVSSANTANNLPAGTYTVTITDDNGCSLVESFTVDLDCEDLTCELPVLSNTVLSDATCGLNNGSAQLMVEGELSDYQFIWPADLSLTNTADNLPAGTYTVTITDADSTHCLIETTFSIGNVDGPEVTVVSITPATCDVANGTAILSPDTLTYTWSDDLTGASRTDLSAQIYQVTVTEPGNNCFDVLTIEIEATNDLTATVLIDQQPDCDASNGIVSVTVSNGSNNYGYDWGNGLTSDATQTGLAAGIYEVLVRDLTTGCTTKQTFSLINEVPQATISITAPPSVDCFGATNATVDYEIAYSPGFAEPAQVEIQDEQGTVFENGSLAPGTYCIIVTDANDCWAGEACFEVLEPAALNLSVASNGVTCETNGSITIEVSGGSNTYQFNWSDLNGADQPQNREDLSVGTYFLTVTDSEGCSVVAGPIAIDNHCVVECITPEVSNIVRVATTCGEQNGAATLEIVGYTGQYDYTWTDSVSTTNYAENLAAGQYFITISEKSNPLCYAVTSVVIENSDGPQASILETTPARCNDRDGAASLTPPSYNYQWSDDVWGANRNDLSAKTYTITVSDPASGCQNVMEVTIEQESPLEVSANIVKEPTCGEADGVVELTTIGGSGNYSYSWGIGASRDDLVAGTYTVTTTDLTTACYTIVQFVLTEDTPGAIITVTPVVQLACYGDANGTVDFEIDYELGFERPQHLEIRNEQGDSISNGSLTAGHYCLLVWDDYGCLAGEACFVVVQPDPLSIDLLIEDALCADNGQIEVTVSGGTGTYLYDWADLPGSMNVEDRSDLPEGNYNLTVTDANGCSSIISNLIVESNCLAIDTIYVSTPYDTPTDSICLDDSELMSSIILTDLCSAPLNGTLNLDTVNHCVVYEPSNGFIGQDTACVISCDATGQCDTTILIITVDPPICTDYLASTDTTVLATDNCVEGAAFCVAIPLEAFYEYAFTDNGLPYRGNTLGCSFDSSYTYSTFIFPSQGQVGPYRLERWVANDNSYEMEFMTIQQLVDSMNVWDPMGEWSYDAAAHLIRGGYSQHTYGSLSIRQLVTNAFTIVDMNSILMPTSTSINLMPGSHELIFEHLPTGCRDTLYTEIYCLTPEVIVDTVVVNTTDTICLSSNELPGSVISMTNACEDASGEWVIFEMEEDNCISYTGMEVGMDSACVVLCDDLGLCDTTYLYVYVEEEATAISWPIANVDADTTLKNRSVDILQSQNDTINGTLEDTYIVSQPQHGSVSFNRDGSIKYTPVQDYCNDEIPDVFSYAICNPVGCDTTTVSIVVQCEAIVVYTGFSPNGDDVNDTFKIQGIENFPNNRLLIFNRWGNEVYNKEGYLNDWDGTWQGKLLPDGTYFYVLEDGEGNAYSGYVQIHR
ncbi:MAG: gliding motility-associated C-terminal domain-containing protein [Bacteroidota bacterium]